MLSACGLDFTGCPSLETILNVSRKFKTLNLSFKGIWCYVSLTLVLLCSWQNTLTKMIAWYNVMSDISSPSFPSLFCLLPSSPPYLPPSFFSSFFLLSSSLTSPPPSPSPFSLVYVDMCVVYAFCVYIYESADSPIGQRRTSGVLLYPFAVSLEEESLTEFELGWLPASLRNPPVSNPRSTGVTSMHAVKPSSLHGGRGFELWCSCLALSSPRLFSGCVWCCHTETL